MRKAHNSKFKTLFQSILLRRHSDMRAEVAREGALVGEMEIGGNPVLPLTMMPRYLREQFFMGLFVFNIFHMYLAGATGYGIYTILDDCILSILFSAVTIFSRSPLPFVERRSRCRPYFDRIWSFIISR